MLNVLINVFSNVNHILQKILVLFCSATRWLLLDESNKSDVSIDMNNVQGDRPHVQLQSSEVSSGKSFVELGLEQMKLP